jgi:hypothetical protein
MIKISASLETCMIVLLIYLGLCSSCREGSRTVAMDGRKGEKAGRRLGMDPTGGWEIERQVGIGPPGREGEEIGARWSFPTPSPRWHATSQKVAKMLT